MAASDEVSSRHHSEALDQISDDELSANAANESVEDREAHRLRNRKRANRRRDANKPRNRAHRNLDAQFAAAQDRGFNTPVANITGMTTLLTNNPDPAVQSAFCMAQRALLQIDAQNPLPSLSQGRREGGGESSTSRTPDGHPKQRAAPSNQHPTRQQGQQASCGGGAPQRPRPTPRPPQQEASMGNYRRANLEQLPTGDLREKINIGRDARSIIDNRRAEHVGAVRNATQDDCDHFPAFSSRFDDYKYPEGFEPIDITKDDGKQSPQQWV